MPPLVSEYGANPTGALSKSNVAWARGRGRGEEGGGDPKGGGGGGRHRKRWGGWGEPPGPRGGPAPQTMGREEPEGKGARPNRGAPGEGGPGGGPRGGGGGGG